MPVEMNIDSNSPMSTVLENFPGAQRALFRRYHIGGCSSVGFSRKARSFTRNDLLTSRAGLINFTSLCRDLR
jgi:hypothetical protein